MANEPLSLGRLIEVLRAMGHNYGAVLDEGGLVVLDCEFPGEGGIYSLHFDASRDGKMPFGDLADQLELAGIDMAVFLAHLSTIP